MTAMSAAKSCRSVLHISRGMSVCQTCCFALWAPFCCYGDCDGGCKEQPFCIALSKGHDLSQSSCVALCAAFSYFVQHLQSRAPRRHRNQDVVGCYAMRIKAFSVLMTRLDKSFGCAQFYVTNHTGNFSFCQCPGLYTRVALHKHASHFEGTR